MYNPLSSFIGLRYSLTKKHNSLLSFVSLISMLGISIGVLVLIVALSVINGSIATMREEALKSVPHAVISNKEFSNKWIDQVNILRQAQGILGVAPFLEGEALMRHQGEIRFVRLRGVTPDLESNVIANSGEIYLDLLAELERTDNGIVLGTRLAGSLGIYGSQELSILPIGNLLARSFSDSQGFTVVGFADFGIYGNNNIALVNLRDAENLFKNDSGAEVQLRLKVADVFKAKSIAEQALDQSAGTSVRVWSEDQASLFNALNMEKILTSFMLLMIIAIGAINIISTLVMVVSDKSADIAILRTMGASRLTIMRIFVVQGMIAGVFGTLIGALLGMLVANNITELSLFIERLLNRLFLDSNIYFISHLQTQINLSEVFLVCSAALLISFIATLYPAYRASKVHPAEALRYE